MEFLIAEVDDELLEAVGVKDLEAEDVQEAEHSLAAHGLHLGIKTILTQRNSLKAALKFWIPEITKSYPFRAEGRKNSNALVKAEVPLTSFTNSTYKCLQYPTDVSLDLCLTPSSQEPRRSYTVVWKWYYTKRKDYYQESEVIHMVVLKNTLPGLYST